MMMENMTISSGIREIRPFYRILDPIDPLLYEKEREDLDRFVCKQGLFGSEFRKEGFSGRTLGGRDIELQ
jgi:hypothetical protein